MTRARFGILCVATIASAFGLWSVVAVAAQESQPDVPERAAAYLSVATPGDSVRVNLSGGGSLEGVLESREGGEVIVSVEGVQMRLRESDVARVIRLQSPREQFERMRANTGDRDEVALLALARWASDADLLDEALGVVGEVLEFNPASREGAKLNRDIAFLLKLRQDAGEPAPEDVGDDRRAELAALRINNFPYLTDDQVNLIKVYEVDLKNPPRIQVPTKAINTLFEKYEDHFLVPSTEEGQRAFKKMTDAEMLDVIFRVRARELYPQVRIVGQLEQMRLFRDRINAGWLTRSCGSTDCHGGLDGGRFLISNRWRRTERGVYTNFHILENFETSDGLPMIDQEQPEFSAMLQMGLPRETALWPHPEVLGWRPTFRDEEDRWFLRTVEWIEGLYKPRPEYDLGYVLPGERPRDELRGGPRVPDAGDAANPGPAGTEEQPPAQR